jgi:DNA-directed RNA polymerase specialized sigma24 family protein
LIGIARNRIIDLIRKRKKGQGGSMIELHEDQLSQRTITEAFDHALERYIFEQAWDWLCENTQGTDGSMRAFELTALRGVPVAEAAEQCSMTVDQVYVARSRVSARLRDAVERFDQAYRDGL